MTSNKTKDKVAITLKGAGITFGSKISPLTAANVLKICMAAEQENIGSIMPQTLITEAPIGEQKISLGEFVHKHEPTTYPEKVLTIAAYLKEFKNKESFSPEDIRPLFRTIGDVPPANFGRDFRIALGNSWIAPDDRDPNTFYVTSLGVKALSSNFSGESIKKQSIRKRRKGGVDKEKKEKTGG